MNYGSLLQVYKDRNLFICSNCEAGCHYVGTPFPNYCSRCGTMFTSISMTSYVEPEEPDEDESDIKESLWQHIKRGCFESDTY